MFRDKFVRRKHLMGFDATKVLSLVLICRRSTWDIAAGTAWDNYGICEHLSPTHNLSQSFTTDLPVKLS